MGRGAANGAVRMRIGGEQVPSIEQEAEHMIPASWRRGDFGCVITAAATSRKGVNTMWLMF